MNIKITMNLLFHLVYFTSFLDQFLGTLYMSLFLFLEKENLSFYVIMTVLKFGFSALIGFIIDHVQYTFNLLFGSQLLILFSYAFYLVFIVKLLFQQDIYDYLYFANGFLILGQQLGSIIILTLISKHHERNNVPYQISIFQKYSFSGKLFCSVIIFILWEILSNSKAEETFHTLIQTNKEILIILSIIPFIILITITIFLYQSFAFFKQEAEELMPEIKLIPVQQKGNLLQALKNIFKTDSAWVALSAGIIMGIIKIWLAYQQNQVFIRAKDSTFVRANDSFFVRFKDSIFGCYMVLELPTIISLSLVSMIVINFEDEAISLQALIDKGIDSFVLFLLSILFTTSLNTLNTEDDVENILFALISIFQQYYFTVISISGASIIGIHKENYRNQGLTFGLLGMIENGFAVWVVLAMDYGLTKNGIIYGFAFGYSLISIISSKMLQFDKQVNRLRLNKVAIIEQNIKNDESEELEQ